MALFRLASSCSAVRDDRRCATPASRNRACSASVLVPRLRLHAWAPTRSPAKSVYVKPMLTVPKLTGVPFSTHVTAPAVANRSSIARAARTVPAVAGTTPLRRPPVRPSMASLLPSRTCRTRASAGKGRSEQAALVRGYCAVPVGRGPLRDFHAQDAHGGREKAGRSFGWKALLAANGEFSSRYVPFETSTAAAAAQ